MPTQGQPVAYPGITSGAAIAMLKSRTPKFLDCGQRWRTGGGEAVVVWSDLHTGVALLRHSSGEELLHDPKTGECAGLTNDDKFCLKEYLGLDGAEASTAATQPKCEVGYRLKIAEETGGLKDPAQNDYGGKVGSLVYDPFLRTHYVIFGKAIFMMTSEMLVKTVAHTFVNNGCRRARCEHCDTMGHYDFSSGTYIAE